MEKCERCRVPRFQRTLKKVCETEPRACLPDGARVPRNDARGLRFFFAKFHRRFWQRQRSTKCAVRVKTAFMWAESAAPFNRRPPAGLVGAFPWRLGGRGWPADTICLRRPSGGDPRGDPSAIFPGWLVAKSKWRRIANRLIGELTCAWRRDGAASGLTRPHPARALPSNDAPLFRQLT